MPLRRPPWTPEPYVSPGRPVGFARAESLDGPPQPAPALPAAEGDVFAGIRFKPYRNVAGERCVHCGEPAVHWHHWLEQQHLKTAARAERLPRARARQRFKRLIHDWRNISAVCADCHDIGSTNHGGKFTFADVPPAAFAFTLELGQEWFAKLRRTYTH